MYQQERGHPLIHVSKLPVPSSSLNMYAMRYLAKLDLSVSWVCHEGG